MVTATIQERVEFWYSTRTGMREIGNGILLHSGVLKIVLHISRDLVWFKISILLSAVSQLGKKA